MSLFKYLDFDSNHSTFTNESLVWLLDYRNFIHFLNLRLLFKMNTYVYISYSLSKLGLFIINVYYKLFIINVYLRDYSLFVSSDTLEKGFLHILIQLFDN